MTPVPEDLFVRLPHVAEIAKVLGATVAPLRVHIKLHGVYRLRAEDPCLAIGTYRIHALAVMYPIRHLGKRAVTGTRTSVLSPQMNVTTYSKWALVVRILRTDPVLT